MPGRNPEPKTTPALSSRNGWRSWRFLLQYDADASGAPSETCEVGKKSDSRKPRTRSIDMRKKLSLLLPLLGLALFVFIVARTGLENIADVFRASDVRMLIFTPVIVFFIVILRGLRWQYLMRVLGIEYSLWKSSSVWTIGFFAAAVTPAKAGDAVRALYVKEDTGRRFGEAFLTVFIDRLWDLLFVLALGVVSALLFSRYYIEIPSIWVFFLASAGIAACVYLATNRKLMRRLLKPVFDAMVPQKYKEMFSLNIHTFYDSLSHYRRDWVTMLVAFALTVVCWALVFFLAWYVTFMFDLDVEPAYMFLIMPVVTLVELLPISVSGLGTREATVIYFFSVVGVSSVAAVGFSIGYLLMGTYLIALFGFVMWIRHPVKLGA